MPSRWIAKKMYKYCCLFSLLFVWTNVMRFVSQENFTSVTLMCPSVILAQRSFQIWCIKCVSVVQYKQGESVLGWIGSWSVLARLTDFGASHCFGLSRRSAPQGATGCRRALRKTQMNPGRQTIVSRWQDTSQLSAHFYLSLLLCSLLTALSPLSAF